MTNSRRRKIRTFSKQMRLENKYLLCYCIQNWNVFGNEFFYELNKCFYSVQKLTYRRKTPISDLFDVTNSRNSVMIRWIYLVCG